MPETNEAPPIAAAVITRDGRVLLVKRAIAEGSLSWQFPAGVIEAGESPVAAAIRETKEETGLTVRARARLGERIHPDTKRRIHYVACTPVSGEVFVADDEVTDARWLTLAKLPHLVPLGVYGPVQSYLNLVLPWG